ncbi:MAG: transglycosylase SLT domain-containing protein [Arenicella sp.]
MIEYHNFLAPRSFEKIIASQTLRVGYLKSPDIAYTFEGKNYGYEYGVLNEFARKQGLNIELIPISSDNLFYALNLNNIDIAIGGFTDLKANEPFVETSQPWDTQTAILIERRQKEKARIDSLKAINGTVYAGKRMSDTSFDNTLPEKVFLRPSTTNELTLLEKVSNDDLSYAISTLGRLRILQKYFPKLRRLSTLDKTIDLVWLFPKRVDPKLLNQVNLFLGQKSTVKFKRSLMDKLYQKPKYLHYLDTLAIYEHMKTRLPEYRNWFKQAAKEYGMDWTLLAAISYQESTWTVTAVSPTQVRGLMQITTKTAKELGVTNRLDPFSTIFAAAKYLSDLRSRVPERVLEPDRTWMAVGAYNLGMSHILKSYKTARSAKIQHITWKNLADYYLPYLYTFNKDDTFVRGEQAVKYVARIQEFEKILRYHAAH